MHSQSLKAGLAAAFISLSSIAAFADSAPPVVVEEPHVGIVLDQLSNAMDGIRTEHKDRNISAAETAKLDRQAMNIRRDAENIAAKNHGRIPGGEYRQLLTRIERLGSESGASTSVYTLDDQRT